MQARHVVITGASRGLGLELARQHLEAGDVVFATCRAPEAASALTALAARHAPRCTVAALDVGDEGSITRAAEAARAALKHVDVLWSNAGVYPGSPGTPVQEVPLGRLRASDGLEVLRVNAVGAVLVAQAFLPLLRALVGLRLGVGQPRHAVLVRGLEGGAQHAAPLAGLRRRGARGDRADALAGLGADRHGRAERAGCAGRGGDGPAPGGRFFDWRGRPVAW